MLLSVLSNFSVAFFVLPSYFSHPSAAVSFSFSPSSFCRCEKTPDPLKFRISTSCEAQPIFAVDFQFQFLKNSCTVSIRSRLLFAIPVSPFVSSCTGPRSALCYPRLLS